MPQDRLRVGILLDSYEVADWVAEIIRYFIAHPQLTTVLAVLNEVQPNGPVHSSLWDRVKNNRFLFYRFHAWDQRRAAQVSPCDDALRRQEGMSSRCSSRFRCSCR